MDNHTKINVCVIGDTHGHLQLGLCMAARWQRELRTSFDAVFLCGDVGTFTLVEQLDSTTRRHGKANPCELEFLTQWSTVPQAPWLGRIFADVKAGGLGLMCPVVMVHGNHEGFAHLETLATPPAKDPLECRVLPAVDTGGYIRYLPTGCKCVTPGGLIIGGVGGIERGQRYAKYHDLAYLDEDAILNILSGPSMDLLITHQGPSSLQDEEHGSALLQMILDEGNPRAWCHGHSIRSPEIATAGPNGKTTVVPLADIAFPCKGLEPDDPGKDGWALLCFGQELLVQRARPDFWREYRRHRWHELPDGRLVCPDLTQWIP